MIAFVLRLYPFFCFCGKIIKLVQPLKRLLRFLMIFNPLAAVRFCGGLSRKSVRIRREVPPFFINVSAPFLFFVFSCPGDAEKSEILFADRKI